MKNSGTGIVMYSTGSAYTVRDCSDGTTVESRIRGKLKLKGVRSTNPVAVGDAVDYRIDPDGTGIITGIHPRSNYIIRRSSNLSKESHILAANIDQAALVATLLFPETKYEFIDRFLVTCEAYGIPALIILNKSDTLDGFPGAADEFRRIYEPAGYRVVVISALKDDNTAVLEDLLRDKTTLFSGNSGVGKSTLLKRLNPQADVRIAEISGRHLKGRHTTTFSRMYPLPFGGYVIDTPGIKGFGLIDIHPSELYRYYPEMMRRAAACQYYNCTHTHEPGCAVKEAVETGDIAASRYVSYLKTLEEDEKYRK